MQDSIIDEVNKHPWIIDIIKNRYDGYCDNLYDFYDRLLFRSSLIDDEQIADYLFDSKIMGVALTLKKYNFKEHNV